MSLLRSQRMGVFTDSERVEECSDSGQLAFSVRWSDIQRITAWRLCIPDEPCSLMLEIAPDPVTGTKPHSVHDYNEAAWQSWIDALTKYVPGFTIDLVRSALDLREGENAIHILVRDFQQDPDDDRATSATDEALSEWLDGLYEANQAVFQHPERRPPPRSSLFPFTTCRRRCRTAGGINTLETARPTICQTCVVPCARSAVRALWIS